MAKKTIKVTQIASPIGKPKDQRATLIGLGLNKMHMQKGCHAWNFIACVAICTPHSKIPAQHSPLSTLFQSIKLSFI